MENLKTRAIFGWMCAVDFDCEMGMASGGTTVYASEQELRRTRVCVHECGVATVVTLSKEDFFNLVTKAGLLESDFITNLNEDEVIWPKSEESNA